MSFLPEFSILRGKASVSEPVEAKSSAVTATSAVAATSAAPIPITASANGKREVSLAGSEGQVASAESSESSLLKSLDISALKLSTESSAEKTKRFLREQEAWRAQMLSDMSTSIKTLISESYGKSTLAAGPIGDDFPPLVHVIGLMNQIMQHGLKGKRFGFGKRSYWDWIAEYLPKMLPEANSAILSIREMTNFSSQQKGIAWIKMTLMEKQLAAFTKALVEDTELMNLAYEPHAFLRADQSNVLLGLLLSLNTFDVYLDVRNVDAVPDAPTEKEMTVGSLPTQEPEPSSYSAPAPISAAAVPDAPLIHVNQPETLLEPEEEPAAVPEATVEPEAPSPTVPAAPASVPAPASVIAPAKAAAVDDQQSMMRQFTLLAEQKTYVEETNKDLQNKIATTREQLNERIRKEEEMQLQVGNMQEQLRRAEAARQTAETEMKALKEKTARQLQALKDDFEIERKSFATQKAEINALFQKELKNTRALEALLDEERVQRGTAESRSTAAESTLEAARLEFDGERCESNREKAALEEQIAEALRQVEEISTAKSKLTVELQRAKNKMKQLKAESKQWEDASAALNSEAANALSTATEMKTARERVEDNMRQLMSALEQERSRSAGLSSQVASLEAQLADRERHVQELLRREKDLMAQVEAGKAVARELEETRREVAKLTDSVKERDETIIELADELGKTRVTVDTLEEFKTSVKSSEWVADHAATHCKGCDSGFSVTLRKHHCRNCGDIFCANCSQRKVMLPSSKNPVRVCDSCWTNILGKSSTS